MSRNSCQTATSNSSVEQPVHLRIKSATSTDKTQPTYLGESLCRRQTLCTPVETLAKRRWLMSDGIAEGWVETAGLEKVSVAQPYVDLYLRRLH